MHRFLHSSDKCYNSCRILISKYTFVITCGIIIKGLSSLWRGECFSYVSLICAGPLLMTLFLFPLIRSVNENERAHLDSRRSSDAIWLNFRPSLPITSKKTFLNFLKILSNQSEKIKISSTNKSFPSDSNAPSRQHRVKRLTRALSHSFVCS